MHKLIRYLLTPSVSERPDIFQVYRTVQDSTLFSKLTLTETNNFSMKQTVTSYLIIYSEACSRKGCGVGGRSNVSPSRSHLIYQLIRGYFIERRRCLYSLTRYFLLRMRLLELPKPSEWGCHPIV
jgi:hypothetical protein